MIKIEIIHNQTVLSQLKELMKTDKLYGFTSLLVHEGFGPLKGEFKEDHLGDQQFLSIILLEEKAKADLFLSELDKRVKGNKFLALTSEVNFQKLGV